MQDDLGLVRSTIARGASPEPAPSIWAFVVSILPLVFPLNVAAIGLGLWTVLTSVSDMTTPERLGTWLLIVVPLAVWLLAVWLLGRLGVYTNPVAVQLGILFPPVIGLSLLTRLPHVPEVLAATPHSWLIGFMLIRVVGGIFLIAARSGEVDRPWFNLSAGSLDVLIGATALPIAMWVSSGSPSAVPIAIGWNVIGLLDFVLAIVLARRFGDGPPEMLMLDTPVISALKPTIRGIVTFGVPVAIIVHSLSLWQLMTA